MEWALLVSYLYPLFTRRVYVCVCVYRARSGYLKFDQTRRWKMVAAWRVAAAEDKRKSESLCSFTVSPCDSVFFSLPPPMFQTSLFPTPILFCASFEPSLAKFDPHLMELQNENKKSFVGSQLQWTWMPGCSSLVWLLLLLLLFTVRTVRFVISEREDFSIDLYTYLSVVWEWAKIWRRVAQSMKTKQRRSSRAGGS
jgi:hypothetical protein